MARRRHQLRRWWEICGAGGELLTPDREFGRCKNRGISLGLFFRSGQSRLPLILFMG
jgi:hypothetical protein